MTTTGQYSFDFGQAGTQVRPSTDIMPASTMMSDEALDRHKAHHTRKSRAALVPSDAEAPHTQLDCLVGHASTITDYGPVTAALDETSSDKGDDATGYSEIEIPPTLRPQSACPALRPVDFGVALTMLEASGAFNDVQMCRHRSYVNVAAKALQKVERNPDLTLLPCEPRLLRQALAGFYPAQARIKTEQWSSIVCGLRRVLRMTGWLRPVQRRSPRSLAWERVLGDIDNKAQLASIRKLANFATSIGTEPQAVEHKTFDLFRDWLEEHSLTLGHRGVAITARQTWRRLCREHPEWGIESLPMQPRYNLVATRKAELPESFHASVQLYIARCATPDPFDDAITRKLAPETLKKRRTTCFLAAQYLLDLEWPAEQFTDLRAICTPDAIRAVLREQFRRHSPDGRTWPAGAKPMASHLLTIAAQIGQLNAVELVEVQRIVTRVPKSRQGFPRKTRERLAAFDDERVLRDFYGLPQILWREAQQLEKGGKLRQARAKAKYAVALAILLVKPLRVGELASLDFLRDFRRDRKGRIVGLSIPGEHTKTGVPIEAAIDATFARRIVEYFDRFVRPKQGGDSYIFPRQSSGCVTGNELSQGLAREVRRHLGIEFNPHLVRALIATIILDSDPDAVAVAQRMLEHMNVETTIRHYGMQRGRAAQRQYEQFLARTLRGRRS